MNTKNVFNVLFNGKKVGTASGLSFNTSDGQRRAHEQARLIKRYGTTTPTSRQRELYAKKKKKSRHKKGK